MVKVDKCNDSHDYAKEREQIWRNHAVSFIGGWQSSVVAHILHDPNYFIPALSKVLCSTNVWCYSSGLSSHRLNRQKRDRGPRTKV